MQPGDLNFLEPSGHLRPVKGLIYFYLRQGEVRETRVNGSETEPAINGLIRLTVIPFILRSAFRDNGDRGNTVVKVLRYKSEGRWFDSRWCHWDFSLT